jgi:PAS domain S-box-containing protein
MSKRGASDLSGYTRDPMPWRDAVVDACALVVIDRARAVLAWNRAAEAMSGRPAPATLGRPVTESAPLFRDERIAESISRALAGAQARVAEVERGLLREASREARPGWLELTCTPWRDADGGVAGVAVRMTDVTERRRQARFTDALEAIAHSLASSLDLDGVLDTVADHARRVMDAEAALVIGWDGQAPAFTILRATGRLSREYAAAGSLLAGRGPIHRAFTRVRPSATRNILTDPECWVPDGRRRQIEREGYKAVAAAPLAARGRVHGALVVHDWTERDFSPAELDALVRLGEQAALAIDTARMSGEARRRAARLGDLVAVTRSVSASLDTVDVLQRIADAAAKLAPGVTALVHVHDAERKTLRTDAFSGGEPVDLPAEFPVTLGLPGLVFAENRARLVEAPAEHPRTLAPEWWRAHPGASYYGVPIVAGETVVGVLGCIVVGRPPSREEQEIIQLLAAHAGIAIRNAAQYEAERLQAERIRALADVNRRISAALEVDELLRTIAESAANLTGVRFASFWVADSRRRLLTLSRGSDSRLAADFPTQRATFEQGAVGWTARHRTPLVIDDVFADDRVLHVDWRLRWGLRSLAAYPVLAGDELLAILLLDHAQPIRLAGDARGMMELFIAQAAVAIQNARLYEQARGRRDIAEAVARLGRELTATLDVARIAEAVARGAVDLLEGRSAAVYRSEPDGSLRVLSAYGMDAAGMADLVLAPGEGAAGRAAAGRRPWTSRDVLADPAISVSPGFAAAVDRAGFRAVAAVPLIAHDRVVGALGIGAEAGREFSADELQALQAFGDQAALALENARLYDESERERREAAALAAAARRLALSLDVDDIAREFVEALRELFGADAAAFYRVCEDGAIVPVALAGAAPPHPPSGARMPRGADVVGRAIEARRATWSRDGLDDGRAGVPEDGGEPRLPAGHRGVLAVPLLAKDEVVGALAIADRGPRDFDPREIALLQAFADQAALALANARLYASARDSLARLRETQAQLVQAAKMSALGQLVAGVAHELNNPLSVVIGYGQLLLARDVPAPVRRPIELMVAQGDRMAKIVRNLLFFARQRPPERGAVNLNQVLEETLALRRSQLTLSGIAVSAELAPDLPAIAGDAQQLQQVFLNLLLNAEQAIGEGRSEGRRGGRIVLCTGTTADRTVVRAEVTDDGPGIPAEALARLFEPFFTTKAVGAGTGLGLSVSYGIVQEHGGRLTADSGGGRTTFAVELPVSRPERVSPAIAPPPPLRADGHAALVVEDEPSVLEVVVELLESTGWHVEVADGGRCGRERLRARRFDLVVSDMRMADGGGEEFYRVATAEDPTLAGRFIFITGDTANPDAWRFFKQTGVPVIEKPFKAAVFLDAVRRTVGALTAPDRGA